MSFALTKIQGWLRPCTYKWNTFNFLILEISDLSTRKIYNRKPKIQFAKIIRRYKGFQKIGDEFLKCILSILIGEENSMAAEQEETENGKKLLVKGNRKL